MPKKLIIGALVLVIIIIAAVFTRPKVPNVMKIGIINVLSGDYATLGENFGKGVELAKAEFIKNNPDKKIEIVVEDGGMEPAKALSAYKKLIEIDKVDGLIVATSQGINAIYGEVSKLTIPVVTYGAQSVPETSDNVFHIFPSSIPVEVALGSLVSSLDTANQGSTTKDIVGIYTNDPAIVNFYSAFQAGVGADIADFNLDPGSKDIRTIVTKVIAQKPKFIFMSNYANLGAQFIKEYKTLSKGKGNATFVFDMTLNESTSEYEKILGDLKTLDGSIVVSLKSTDQTSFIAKYKEKYSADPGQLSDYGYDAMSILMNNPSVSQLQNAKFAGATGDIGFDPVGRRIPVFSLSTLKDGKIPEYKP